ncbi:hypothetical protein ACIRJM_04050 [Streptomyces sp. NPDC102405]|uniref:hypothetical protein n=1 Tax=Streptomyces sp. NPDC102405 TaxID=3366170 RepID=UPI00382006D5
MWCRRCPPSADSSSGSARSHRSGIAAFELAHADDERAQAAGGEPRYQTSIGDNPDNPALFSSPDALRFYRDLVPAGAGRAPSRRSARRT